MATRDPKVARAIPLKDLIALMRELAWAHGIRRVELARHLSDLKGPTVATLKAAGDEGIVQALAKSGLSDRELAAKLGYKSRSAVTDAVSRHRRRLAGEL
jgi:hypothetical protein